MGFFGKLWKAVKSPFTKKGWSKTKNAFRKGYNTLNHALHKGLNYADKYVLKPTEHLANAVSKAPIIGYTPFGSLAGAVAGTIDRLTGPC